MPDDLSTLASEVREDLHQDEELRQPLPKATVNIPLLTEMWIRWLPVALFFAGAAFVAWTAIMVVMVGRYHDALTKMDSRVHVLEEMLVNTTKAYDGEYWSRQCRDGRLELPPGCHTITTGTDNTRVGNPSVP